MTKQHATKNAKKQPLPTQAPTSTPAAVPQEEEALFNLLGVALAPDEQISVGIDVHQNSYHVALWAHRAMVLLKEWTQAADDQALLRKLEPLRSRLANIYYEAGPCGFVLARCLQAAKLPVSVISPAHTPAKPVPDPKCDRLDAIGLAEYGAKGLLRAVYIPSEQEEQDRQVFRTREQRKRQLARVKQQIKSLLLMHGVRLAVGLKAAWSKAGLAELASRPLPAQLRWSLDELLAELAEARAAVARANLRLREMARSERYQAPVSRLMSVPGVGLIVAMGWLLELMDLARFESAPRLGRFLGLAPSTPSSGEKTTSAGRLSGGMSTLRSLLIEAAWRWRQCDPYARMQYEKLLRNTACKQKAITALARKLAIILWRIAQGSLPYVPGLQRVPPAVAGMLVAPKPAKARKPQQEATAAQPKQLAQAPKPTANTKPRRLARA